MITSSFCLSKISVFVKRLNMSRGPYSWRGSLYGNEYWPSMMYKLIVLENY